MYVWLCTQVCRGQGSDVWLCVDNADGTGVTVTDAYATAYLRACALPVGAVEREAGTSCVVEACCGYVIIVS